jgi:flavin reductase (DIM6/NTAB) family NADH-FMN oxidoreductase RutF
MNDKALFTISCGLYVVGVRNGEGYGGCIVDAFIQSTNFPATVILCSQKHTRTNECIKETGEFSVSVLREEVDPLTVSIFGFQSTRHMQKWPHVPHVFQRDLPVLQETAAWYVCKVIHTYEMATHTLFHCELLESEIGEGTPLTYGHYRAHMRHATAAAFQEFKKRHAPAPAVEAEAK